MAGSKINNYTQLDTNILQLQLTSDANFKGKHLVSLTNYDTTAESKVAAGSIIEVGGALYKFASDETILDTYSVSNGNVYIMIVPSTTTCTAVYTNTAPTWDDSKQGWYGTSGTAGYRYLEFILIKSGTTWHKIKSEGFIVYPQAIYAYHSTGQSITTLPTKVIFNVKDHDVYNLYSTSTGTFTCISQGLYSINVNGYIYNANSGSYLYLYYNGSQITERNTPSGSVPLDININKYLNYGDTIEVYAYGDGSSEISFTSLSIYKI